VTVGELGTGVNIARGSTPSGNVRRWTPMDMAQ